MGDIRPVEQEQKRVAEIIEKHVRYFNGRVDDATALQNCADAANDILKYLKRRDSQLNRSAHAPSLEAPTQRGFEIWANSKSAELDMCDSSACKEQPHYWSTITQGMWDAWQAGFAVGQRAPTEEARKILFDGMECKEGRFEDCKDSLRVLAIRAANAISWARNEGYREAFLAGQRAPADLKAVWESAIEAASRSCEFDDPQMAQRIRALSYPGPQKS